MKLVSIARPEDLDLAIPPLNEGRSGLTLREIADGYSRWVTRNWVRACNVEYRAGPDGPSVSLLAQGGKLWNTGDPRWPVFVVVGNNAEIRDSISETEAKRAKFAFSAGPWIVRAGHVCNISEEISKCGYSGLRPADVCERAAIGIRADGAVVHFATDAATLDEVASEMRVLGCANAISLDGGGSTCVLNPDGTVLLGYATRQVCSALIFLKLIDETVVPDSPPTAEKWTRIYLSPSQQPWNKGIGDYGDEQQRMHELAWLIGYHLIKARCSVAISRRDQQLSDVVKSSNAWRSTLHLCIHSNSLPDDPELKKHAKLGVECFYYPGSTIGRRVAEAIYASLGRINPHGKRRCESRSDLMELRDTDAPAVYVEVGFHDNEQEAKWIVENMGLIARTIAETVVKALSA